jgi:hypothetical protein
LLSDSDFQAVVTVSPPLRLAQVISDKAGRRPILRMLMWRDLRF